MVAKVKETFIDDPKYSNDSEPISFFKDEEYLVGIQDLSGGKEGEPIKHNYIVYDQKTGRRILTTFNQQEFDNNFERVTN